MYSPKFSPGKYGAADQGELYQIPYITVQWQCGFFRLLLSQK